MRFSCEVGEYESQRHFLKIANHLSLALLKTVIFDCPLGCIILSLRLYHLVPWAGPSCCLNWCLIMQFSCKVGKYEGQQHFLKLQALF
ncbi:hypothetical protein BC938DRAFT_479569 [Jimgerdemannia flammicorona]|uniref:Uncharacterized protein n=1 Tax=Jimgerdemannia flammicorona TaxID=994334 RepID=A0A433QKL7_9FUNG|nr:hypothetical protein BC938DRAFT_479569 [Jimgerdemannia flammicorona]